MGISKKRDWTPGRWAIGVKVITPDGSTIEFDAPRIPEDVGRAIWEMIREQLINRDRVLITETAPKE